MILPPTTSSGGERAFRVLGLATVILPLAFLAVLIVSTIIAGAPRFDGTLFTEGPSRFPDKAGLMPALIGSAWLMVLTAGIALPVGIGAALYLEEYARPTRVTAFIELVIATLAGVPSIIYGLLGLQVFVHTLDLGQSILSGACTLALLVLPMIIMASREALRTVPQSLREGALALGGDRWVTLRTVIMPLALPGMLTGIILAMARAIGETAPLLAIGALLYIREAPLSPTDPFTALVIQIFNWVGRPQAGFQAVAAAGIMVLLLLMLFMNLTAILLRRRLQQRIGG